MNTFCVLLGIQELITCVTFGDDRLKGLGVARGRISRFPIDLRAFLSGQLPLYSKLRNQTKRMAASLRKKYFQNKIESLHSLDPHTLWTKIKNFLQFPDSNRLQSLHDSQSDAGLPIHSFIHS